MSWNKESASGKPNSNVRINLEYRCRDCEFCRGKGLYTIFDVRYEGLDYVEQKSPDGRLHRFVRIDTIPCICPLGSWIRDTRQQEATTVRQINLQHVIEGQQHVRNWSLTDPRFKHIDPKKPAEPGMLRAIINEIPTVVNHVNDLDRKQKQFIRENMLVRFLVNALDPGPATFKDISEWALRGNYGSPSELRTAAGLARLKIQFIDKVETWSLE